MRKIDRRQYKLTQIGKGRPFVKPKIKVKEGRGKGRREA